MVAELRIADVKSANKYLIGEFIIKYRNKKKTVEAFDNESAYTALSPWLELNEVLCMEYDRKVGSDQSVSFQGQGYLQSGDGKSAAGLMASFKIDLNGELNVFVFGEELES